MHARAHPCTPSLSPDRALCTHPGPPLIALFVHLCTPSHLAPCLLGSVLEMMPQVAGVLTNDFGVLVMPAERKEVSGAGSEEVGSEEEKMTLLHSPDRQVHTVESFKSKILLPDHPPEVRPSRTAELPRGSYLFSVASVTSGVTFGYL